MSLKNASLGRILTQNGSPPVDSNISPFYSYFKLKSRNRGNILKTDDRPVLHDQRLLRNGNMPHPPRDGNIRTARFPVIGNEIFDGRLRAIRQIGDERGKTAVQFFGLLRVQFAPFGGQPGGSPPPTASYPVRAANGANCAARSRSGICGWFCET